MATFLHGLSDAFEAVPRVDKHAARTELLLTCRRCVTSINLVAQAQKLITSKRQMSRNHDSDASIPFTQALRAWAKPGPCPFGVLRGENTSAFGYRRSVAAAVAALLLAAQLVAAAHVHPWALVNTVSKDAQLSASDALCPICLFHAQTPATTANAPILARPLSIHRFFAVATLSRLFCAPKPQLFGRAPPASV